MDINFNSKIISLVVVSPCSKNLVNGLILFAVVESMMVQRLASIIC